MLWTVANAWAQDSGGATSAVVLLLFAVGCFLAWAIWPFLGLVLSPRGRGVAGVMLGAFLGPLGVLLCFFLTGERRPLTKAQRLRRIEQEERMRMEVRERLERERAG